MKKLYCYVDETGQDTHGQLFVVTIVILEKNHERVENILILLEKRFRKTLKWSHSSPSQRLAFMKALTFIPHFYGSIFWSRYNHTKSYRDLTAYSIAKAILIKADFPYSSYIMIDGSSKGEERVIKAILKKLQIHAEKIRLVRDESNSFLRLADAFAGCIRDAIEGNIKSQHLVKKFVKQGILKEV